MDYIGLKTIMQAIMKQGKLTNFKRFYLDNVNINGDSVELLLQEVESGIFSESEEIYLSHIKITKNRLDKLREKCRKHKSFVVYE